MSLNNNNKKSFDGKLSSGGLTLVCLNSSLMK